MLWQRVVCSFFSSREVPLETYECVYSRPLSPGLFIEYSVLTALPVELFYSFLFRVPGKQTLNALYRENFSSGNLVSSVLRWCTSGCFHLIILSPVCLALSFKDGGAQCPWRAATFALVLELPRRCTRNMPRSSRVDRGRSALEGSVK